MTGRPTEPSNLTTSLRYMYTCITTLSLYTCSSHEHGCIHIYVHTYMYVHTHACIHASIHPSIYLSIHSTYVRTYIHVHVHIRTYIHTFVCTCTYVYMCLFVFSWTSRLPPHKTPPSMNLISTNPLPPVSMDAGHGALHS